MDALSDVLRAVRLSGAVYFDIRASEPWVAGLARDIESGKREPSDLPVTLVVETADARFVYESDDKDEPRSFWLLGAAVDGLAHRVHWLPIDVTGSEDFASWAFGIFKSPFPVGEC